LFVIRSNLRHIHRSLEVIDSKSAASDIRVGAIHCSFFVIRELLPAIHA
jgi:hypothetical protein